MAHWGMKISQPGQDVLTAADKDLVYTTKYSGMKIKTHNTKATSGTVAHDVSGYIPMFMNFIYDGASKYRYENGSYYGDSSYAGTTNITFPNADNFYFIFIDRGDDS